MGIIFVKVISSILIGLIGLLITLLGLLTSIYILGFVLAFVGFVDASVYLKYVAKSYLLRVLTFLGLNKNKEKDEKIK